MLFSVLWGVMISVQWCVQCTVRCGAACTVGYFVQCTMGYVFQCTVGMLIGLKCSVFVSVQWGAWIRVIGCSQCRHVFVNNFSGVCCTVQWNVDQQKSLVRSVRHFAQL